MTALREFRRNVAVQCLAAAAVAYIPLLILTLIDGTAHGDDLEKPLLKDLSVLVRTLVALPLLAVAGVTIRSRLRWVIEYLDASEMVTGAEQEKFKAAANSHERWYDSRVAWIVSAAAAFVASWLTLVAMMDTRPATWLSDGSGSLAGVSPAGWWFLAVSMTMWLFYAGLRFWQFVNWWIFLTRLSRLDLQVVPTHPDRCGGIGILQTGQVSFAVLVASFSSVLAASVAESLIADSFQLPAVVPYILVLAFICVLILLAPLLGFVPILVQGKRKGLVTYGDLGEGLFRAFDRKWAGLTTDKQAALLGDVDPSSLADYGYCYEVVAEMRFIPLSRSGLITIGVAVVLPFLPLVFIDHSVADILGRLVGIGG